MARTRITVLLTVLALAGAGWFAARAAGEGCAEACQADYADDVAACDAAYQQSLADLEAQHAQCVAEAGWDWLERMRCEVAYESGKDRAEAERNACYNRASDAYADCLIGCQSSPSAP